MGERFCKNEAMPVGVCVFRRLRRSARGAICFCEVVQNGPFPGAEFELGRRVITRCRLPACPTI